MPCVSSPAAGSYVHALLWHSNWAAWIMQPLSNLLSAVERWLQCPRTAMLYKRSQLAFCCLQALWWQQPSQLLKVAGMGLWQQLTSLPSCDLLASLQGPWATWCT